MTTRTLTARLKTWPGIILVSLTALVLLAALSGTVLDVFRTPARVQAIEIEVRGHHDTLQVVYQRVTRADSVLSEVHTESHVIQEQLRDIGFILCDLSDIPATECKVARQP